MAGTSSVFGQSNLLFFFLILVLALGGSQLNVWPLETLLFFFILLVIIMDGGFDWFFNELK